MPTAADVIDQLDDFIQQRALGGLIRHWVELNEQEVAQAIQKFRDQSTFEEVELMGNMLLEVAVSYPGCEVRKKLVIVYGVFAQQMEGIDKQDS